jgi:hypothetical protein
MRSNEYATHRQDKYCKRQCILQLCCDDAPYLHSDGAFYDYIHHSSLQLHFDDALEPHYDDANDDARSVYAMAN